MTHDDLKLKADAHAYLVPPSSRVNLGVNSPGTITSTPTTTTTRY